MRKERSGFYKQEDDTDEGSDHSEISRKKKFSVFPRIKKNHFFLKVNTIKKFERALY